ncbi:MAG TPA: PilT/PilU family type 4a pilus ATPase [Actinomycetota bacterium]|nr:PilT/PilU family type 4a pilus ATPase [Actinomycetota bacterium]
MADTLVAEKVLTAKQVERVRQHEAESGAGFVAAMIANGLDTPKALEVVARFAGVPFVDVASADLDPDAVRNITAAVARQHRVIPVRFEGDRLVLAMADPQDQPALDEVAAFVGLVVEPVLASKEAIAEAIDRVFGPEQTDGPAASRDGEDVAVGQRLGVTIDEPVVDIHDLLEQVLLRGASDLHLTGGVPPVLRVHGDLVHLDEYPVLSAEDLQKLVYGMLTQKQRERMETDLELDFSYSLPGKARYRVNIYMQRGVFGAAFRLIPFSIKSLEELGLPPKLADFSRLPRGLVVVTGPTGSGKSTTLASIIDLINRERPVHIMTVEDPIEFLHAHKRAIINQREVGADTHGFAQALKHVLRQDPDVILVGEMRDLETIQMAITAAETGHLVFGTLHTQDAPQTVDRIIDVFPPHQQQQIRVQLAGALQGVVAQQLLQTRDGTSRVASIEVLIATSAVRNLIREAKTHQIYSQMQAGGQHGMITMDDSLADLVKRGKITFAAGLERCHDAEEFSRMAGGSAGSPAASSRARVIG